jgi:class 3 adenylate cyclase/tetratricopeptide (TPR) repeat protein
LIPRELASKLEAARLSRAMEGERRVVTILFCDIQGSTAAAGRLDPEEWTEIVNGAFELMITPVYKYEGTVARLMGDAILAFFGAPITHEDDPQRAVLAALEILHGIQSYREHIERRYHLEFNVRAGINTGLVVVGAVGTDLRMEYTAMGDAINVAARMEQSASAGSVQIAEETYKLVAPLFDIEALGPIQVKGKNEPVIAYRVSGRKKSPGLLRGLSGLGSPLIGREVEWKQLANLLSDLERGVGGIAMIIGEAGLGKSRLISELKTEAQGGEHRVIWHETGGVSYETEQPYALFQRLIRRERDLASNDPPEILLEKLVPLIETAPAEEQENWRQVLFPLFGLTTRTAEPPLEGEAYRGLLFTVMTALWSRWAAEHPLVLVCDDLHWADPASVELLLHLLPLVERAPLLLVCAMRADRQSPGWKLKQVAENDYPHRYTELLIRPLNVRESGDLVDKLLQAPTIPPHLRDIVLEKAEGNPFFIEEVMRSLIDRDLIADGDTGSDWAGKNAETRIDIPSNLQALILSRIDRLEEESRRTLQLAAVIGRSFYFRVLQRVAGLIPEIDNQVLVLQRAEMIRESARIPELEYIFKHPLTQEVAYNTILLRQRQDFHRRVGEAIEALFPETQEALYPLLAYHYSRARDQRATRYLTQAGDAAFRLFAIPEALANFTYALAMLKDELQPLDADWIERLTHVYLRRGRCFELQSDFPAAIQNYLEMENLSRELGDQHVALAARVAQATVYAIPTASQNSKKAEEIAGQALALARSLNDEPEEAKIMWVLLLVRMYSGHMPESIPYGERSIEMARRLGLREQLAFSLKDLSLPYLGVGRLQEGRRLLDEAARLWDELRNLPMLVEVFSNLVILSILEGKFDEALELNRKGSQLSREINNEWGQVGCQAFIGWGLGAQGEVDQCLEVVDEMVAIGERVGHPGRFIGPYLKGWLYWKLGARQEALELAKRGVEEAKVFPPFRPLSLALLAELNLDSGNLDTGGDLLAEAVGTRQSIALIDFIFDLAAVDYTLVRGEPRQALSESAALLARAEQIGARYFLPEIWHQRARILASLGVADEAFDALVAARSAAQEIGHRLELWSLQAEIAQELIQRGELQQAEEAGQSAGLIVSAIAGNIADADLRRTFLDHAAMMGITGEQDTLL